jgi:RimJ/RimL family protein N-acetyltransferase
MLARRVWRDNHALAVLIGAMLAFLVVTLAGLVFDQRTITGAPAWLKPTKFALSIAIYAATLMWLLTHVVGRRRMVRLVSWVTAISLFIEMVLIGGAVVADTTSHFNVSTMLNTAVWAMMAFFIALTWAMTLLTAWLLVTQRLPDRVFSQALRFGVVVAAVGMGVGFLMTSPTPAQMVAAEAGGGMPIVGAHSVGVEDGGPGLFVVGWSTEGGDLRVGHFVGLHALQVLPLLGLGLSRLSVRWLSTGARIRLVWVVGLAYLGVVMLTTWQALRGQPLIRPDAATVAAGVALLLAVAVAGAIIVVRARLRMSPEDPETMDVALRALVDGDRDRIFEMMKDKEAVRMAAFTADNPNDRTAFDEWFTRICSNPDSVNRVITLDGLFAGTIASFVIEGDTEVTYWIDRSVWGRGVASRALQLLLTEVAVRPIHARVAADNAGSLRVLEKAGFDRVGMDRGFAAGRGHEIEEVILRKD